MSGGGGSTNTVQTADPWEGVQPYLTEAYQRAAGLYGAGQGPEMYPDSMIAGLNPEMQGALNTQRNFGSELFNTLGSSQQTYLNRPQQLANAYMNLPGEGESIYRDLPALLQQQYNAGGAATAGQQADTANNAAGYWQNQMDPSRLDVASNPLLRDAAQAAVNPMFQNLSESVLPQIAMQGVGTGTLGGSRNQLAQAQAIERTNAQAMDATSRMYAGAYENEANRQLQALGMGSQIQGMQGTPLATLMQTGQTGLGNMMQGEQAYMNTLLNSGQAGMENLFQGQDAYGKNLALLGSMGLENTMAPAQLMQGLDQAQLDELVQKWNYEQNLPYSQLSDYMGMLSGTPWGSTQSMQGPKSNPLTNALGAGLMGYGTASAMGAGAAGSTGLAAMGPWGWAALAGMTALAM